MTYNADGILLAWDEERFNKRLRARKPPRSIQGKKIHFTLTSRAGYRPNVRQQLELTTGKAPEAMLKISGGGKNIAHITKHIAYIARIYKPDYIEKYGEVELEDETGTTLLGKEGVKEVRDAWEKSYYGIPKKGEQKREAFNIVLSMPPGTDREAVTRAARQFALVEFYNHQYVLAPHLDGKHAHVHLCVKAVDREGVRLNPRKGDLHRWREHFADKLRDEGIAANATQRRARGVVRKGEKQAVTWIDKEHQEGKRAAPSNAKQGRAEAVKRELNGFPHINPAKDKIERNRKEAVRAYGKVAHALARSSYETDQHLALKVLAFVKDMPPLKTTHQLEVEAARKAGKEKGWEGVDYQFIR